jgi:hypothetical protein
MASAAAAAMRAAHDERARALLLRGAPAGGGAADCSAVKAEDAGEAKAEPGADANGDAEASPRARAARGGAPPAGPLPQVIVGEEHGKRWFLLVQALT